MKRQRLGSTTEVPDYSALKVVERINNLLEFSINKRSFTWGTRVALDRVWVNTEAVNCPRVQLTRADIESLFCLSEAGVAAFVNQVLGNCSGMHIAGIYDDSIQHEVNLIALPGNTEKSRVRQTQHPIANARRFDQLSIKEAMYYGGMTIIVEDPAMVRNLSLEERQKPLAENPNAPLE
jgi:hypothetical protein